MHISKIARLSLVAALLFSIFIMPPRSVIAEESDTETSNTETKDSDSGHSFVVGALLYIPNRVLDLLDIVRLRVRVGPGLAGGVRATKVAQAYLGTYATVYAGLPGPRLRQTPKSPVGLESHNGVSLSLFDATADGGIGPEYSSTEFGGGAQLGIIGFEFGIDPVEIADFATGLVTVDLRDDDL